MKSISIGLLGLSLFFFACGKNTDTSTSKKPPTKNSEVNTQNPHYPELVDFSWNENGQEKKLSDFKGKVILLNFWATWCPPCKRELPDLSSIARDLDGKDFKIIGISVDEQPGAMESYLKANSLPYTVIHEQGDLLGKYMSVTGGDQNVIPQTFIIYKKGRVVETLIGSRSKQDFLSLINKYL